MPHANGNTEPSVGPSKDEFEEFFFVVFKLDFRQTRRAGGK
jgi:hypothetical protein